MEKLKNKIVLVIDDDERNLFAIMSYLETLEIETKAAYNGAQAILMLQRELKPDMILLDIMMPIMDGYEMLGFIKHTDELKHIPVIVITAKATKADKEKCLEAGAWDYVSKPIDMKALIEKMNHWMA
jgi:two-component system chemotaxis sensor kinase CheA